MAMGIVRTCRTSASLMCRVIGLSQKQILAKARVETQMQSARVSLSSAFAFFHRVRTARRQYRPVVSDTPDHRLNQAIYALFLAGIHNTETELRLTFGTFSNLDRQRAAKIVLDVSRFV